jgi:hypothetical protein
MHQLSVTSLEQAIAQAETTISLTTFNNYVNRPGFRGGLNS